MKRPLSRIVLTALVLATLVVAAGMARGEERPRFARVGDSEGDVWVLRAGDDEWEPCGLNTPLGESDIVETEDDSYAEIQLDNGTLIYIDEETRLDFETLAFNDKGKEKSVFYLPYGDLRVRVPSYGDLIGYLTVEMPSGRAQIDEDTSLRINVKGSDASEVLVYRGQVRLVGKDGAVIVRGGECGYLGSDGRIGPVKNLPNGRDYFDSWCSERSGKYRDVSSRGYLGRDVVYVGAYDLDYHGTWVYIPDHGYCWKPKVRHGWYPYSDGHWVWSVHWGWAWVSYESWGWIPYHYGRWVYSWPWGWVWVPGRVWGPAWVSWVYYGDCVGWAPLCPWDYPCNCYHHRCDGPWTYVYRDSFYRPRWHHRTRRGRRYREYAWGERRYRYMDGKRVNLVDYKRNGPEGPAIAMKLTESGVAGKRTSESDKETFTKRSGVEEKEKRGMERESRSLPEKPVTIEKKSQTSVMQEGENRSEHVLPPKPKATETKAEESRNSESGHGSARSLPPKPANDKSEKSSAKQEARSVWSLEESYEQVSPSGNNEVEEKNSGGSARKTVEQKPQETKKQQTPKSTVSKASRQKRGHR